MSWVHKKPEGLAAHIEVCKYWNRFVKETHLTKLKNMYSDLYKKWKAIDKRKDRSWSAKDFKFWLYLRKVNE